MSCSVPIYWGRIKVSPAVNADATHLYFQIFSYGFNSFEHLWRNPVEEISFQIGEDMCREACGEDLSIFLIKDLIVKDQFGHLCSLHGGLDDEGITKGSRELELAF